MIFWSGFGICVLLFWILFIALFSNYENAEMLAMFPTGALSWFMGYFLNKNIGEYDYEFNPGHTFFFIRMQYWGPIAIIIGILGLALGWK